MAIISAGAALSILLVVTAVADVPGPANTLAPGTSLKQPRTLGKRAVMHVYSYTPKTLEITSVVSRFFKDLDACETAIGDALSIAASHADEGDLVDAQCVAVDPPETIAPPAARHPSAEVTEL